MGDRGPTRIPTAIQDAKGYYLKHPERRPTGEPAVAKPLGTPPKHLSADERKLWKELAKIIPPGVARFSDRASMERLVYLFDRQRKHTITASEGSQLLNLFGRFGMTPSDRAKVSVDAPQDNKLQKFLNKKPTTPIQ